MEKPPTVPGRTLPEKIDHLFRTVRPGKKEYTYQQVANALTERGHAISPAFVHKVRTGGQPNPRVDKLVALADFFGVPAAYLLDDKDSSLVEEDLELLAKLRDQNVRQIALRAAEESPANRALLSQILEAMRTVSGEQGQTPDNDA